MDSRTRTHFSLYRLFRLFIFALITRDLRNTFALASLDETQNFQLLPDSSLWPSTPVPAHTISPAPIVTPETYSSAGKITSPTLSTDETISLLNSELEEAKQRLNNVTAITLEIAPSTDKDSLIRYLPHQTAKTVYAKIREDQIISQRKCDALRIWFDENKSKDNNIAMLMQNLPKAKQQEMAKKILLLAAVHDHVELANIGLTYLDSQTIVDEEDDLSFAQIVIFKNSEKLYRMLQSKNALTQADIEKAYDRALTNTILMTMTVNGKQVPTAGEYLYELWYQSNIDYFLKNSKKISTVVSGHDLLSYAAEHNELPIVRHMIQNYGTKISFTHQLLAGIIALNNGNDEMAKILLPPEFFTDRKNPAIQQNLQILAVVIMNKYETCFASKLAKPAEIEYWFILLDSLYSKHEVDINHFFITPKEIQYTPLLMKLENDIYIPQQRLINYLLDNGADPYIETDLKQIAPTLPMPINGIALVAALGNYPMLRLFKERSYSLSRPDSHRRKPIEYALISIYNHASKANLHKLTDTNLFTLTEITEGTLSAWQTLVNNKPIDKAILTQNRNEFIAYLLEQDSKLFVKKSSSGGYLYHNLPLDLQIRYQNEFHEMHPFLEVSFFETVVIAVIFVTTNYKPFIDSIKIYRQVNNPAQQLTLHAITLAASAILNYGFFQLVLANFLPINSNPYIRDASLFSTTLALGLWSFVFINQMRMKLNRRNQLQQLSELLSDHTWKEIITQDNTYQYETEIRGSQKEIRIQYANLQATVTARFGEDVTIERTVTSLGYRFKLIFTDTPSELYRRQQFLPIVTTVASDVATAAKAPEPDTNRIQSTSKIEMPSTDAPASQSVILQKTASQIFNNETLTLLKRASELQRIATELSNIEDEPNKALAIANVGNLQNQCQEKITQCKLLIQQYCTAVIRARDIVRADFSRKNEQINPAKLTLSNAEGQERILGDDADSKRIINIAKGLLTQEFRDLKPKTFDINAWVKTANAILDEARDGSWLAARRSFTEHYREIEGRTEEFRARLNPISNKHERINTTIDGYVTTANDALITAQTEETREARTISARMTAIEKHERDYLAVINRLFNTAALIDEQERTLVANQQIFIQILERLTARKANLHQQGQKQIAELNAAIAHMGSLADEAKRLNTHAAEYNRMLMILDKPLNIEEQTNSVNALHQKLNQWREQLQRINANIMEAKNLINAIIETYRTLGEEPVEIKNQKDIANARLTEWQTAYQSELGKLTAAEQRCRTPAEGLARRIEYTSNACARHMDHISSTLLGHCNDLDHGYDLATTVHHAMHYQLQRWAGLLQEALPKDILYANNLRQHLVHGYFQALDKPEALILLAKAANDTRYWKKAISDLYRLYLSPHDDDAKVIIARIKQLHDDYFTAIGISLDDPRLKVSKPEKDETKFNDTRPHAGLLTNMQEAIAQVNAFYHNYQKHDHKILPLYFDAAKSALIIIVELLTRAENNKPLRTVLARYFRTIFDFEKFIHQLSTERNVLAHEKHNVISTQGIQYVADEIEPLTLLKDLKNHFATLREAFGASTKTATVIRAGAGSTGTTSSTEKDSTTVTADAT